MPFKYLNSLKIKLDSDRNNIIFCDVLSYVKQRQRYSNFNMKRDRDVQTFLLR